MIRENIVDAYYKYRQTIIERYENPKYLQVIILISPKGMSELMDEEKFIEFIPQADAYACHLWGVKTPIKVRTDLPENTEFIIQSKADYEREEKERLLSKFAKMFDY